MAATTTRTAPRMPRTRTAGEALRGALERSLGNGHLGPVKLAAWGWVAVLGGLMATACARAPEVPRTAEPPEAQPAPAPMPAPAAGVTQWVATRSSDGHQTAESVSAISGGYLSLHRTAKAPYQPLGDALVLRQHAASGVLQWERRFDVEEAWPGQADYGVGAFGALAARSDGSSYLLTTIQGRIDFGAGPLEDGSFLVRLDADGRGVWAVALPKESGLTSNAVAIDGAGNAVVAFVLPSAADEDGSCERANSAVMKFSPAGDLVLTVVLGEGTCRAEVPIPLSVAAHADGEVVVGGVISTTQEPFLTFITAGGARAWTQQFGGTLGRIVGVAFAGRSVVALGSHHSSGPLRWGEATVSPLGSRDTGFVLAAGPDGAPRWARGLGLLPGSEGAIAAAGEAAIYVAALGTVGSEAAQEMLYAVRLGARGELLWMASARRGSGPDDNFSEGVAAIAATADGAAVAGQFSWTEDFGSGPIAPRGTEMFLWRLAP